MAKLNMPNIAAQIASQLTNNITQQLVSGLLPLAQEMANKHEEVLDVLRQLKAGEIELADVVVTDDGCRVMPQRPSVASATDGVSNPTSQVKPVADDTRKPVPAISNVAAR